jgi:hypothetical protein
MMLLEMEGYMKRVKYAPENPEAIQKAISELKKHYGTHGKVAKSLGLPRRTYDDWRSRGVPGLFEERVLIERAERIGG